MDDGLTFNSKTQLQWKDAVLNDKVGFAPRSQSLPDNFINRNNVLPTRSFLSVPLKIRNDKFTGHHSSFLSESEPSLLEKWRSWVRGPLYNDSYQTEPSRSVLQDSLLVTAGGLFLLGAIFFMSRHSVSVPSHHVKNNNARGAAQNSTSSPASSHTMPTSPETVNNAASPNNKVRGVVQGSTGSTSSPPASRHTVPTPPSPATPASFQQVKNNLLHLQLLPGHEDHSQFVSKVTAEIKSLSFDKQKTLLMDNMANGSINKMYVSGYGNVFINAVFTGLSAAKKVELLSIQDTSKRSVLRHQIIETSDLQEMLAGLSSEQKVRLIMDQNLLHEAVGNGRLGPLDVFLEGLTSQQIHTVLRSKNGKNTVLEQAEWDARRAFGISPTDSVETVIDTRLQTGIMDVYYHMYRLIHSAEQRARAAGGIYQKGSYQAEARTKIPNGYPKDTWLKTLELQPWV